MDLIYDERKNNEMVGCVDVFASMVGNVQWMQWGISL